MSTETTAATENEVIEAAVCRTHQLKGVERAFRPETLEAADREYPNGMGLNQLVKVAAYSNGYRDNFEPRVNLEAHQAAFFPVYAYASTISVGTILSNVANKFLREGFNGVDTTPLRIAAIRPVSDFKEITTVSLVGDTTFQQVGRDGEIKHGILGEVTYSNKADTYARMLTITRTDYINDDLGAFITAARKLGRGAALKLNEIFWTKFLDNGSFFTSGRNNVSTDTGALGLTGLQEAETIFVNQTDPDGNPLGITPEILLVPTEVKATAHQLMNSERLINGTSTETQGDENPFRGRFRVESSPYMSNSNYTGNSSSAWYLLADPAAMPVIEIAALNGRVEPVIETADASFYTLGIDMRGYSDVGVELQEYRGGVRADGSAADA